MPRVVWLRGLSASGVSFVSGTTETSTGEGVSASFGSRVETASSARTAFGTAARGRLALVRRRERGFVMPKVVLVHEQDSAFETAVQQL